MNTVKITQYRNSSRESSATIYELQKIMDIEVPLNVKHFKPMNWKRSLKIQALLNVHNFKTQICNGFGGCGE